MTLLLEIIEAAGRVAAVDGVAPPTGYIQQAVDIYQGRGDESGEVAVLEQYVAACPPGVGDPGLLARLADLRDE